MPLVEIDGKLVSVGQEPGLAYGTFKRKLISWNIPNKGLVEMYINPSNLNIKDSKVIKSIRTKGGYVIQYWGEELPELTISGTTGSSGIEGMNVLHDVYRSEQLTLQQATNELTTNGVISSIQSLISGFTSITNNFNLETSLSVGNVLSSASGIVDPITSEAISVASKTISDPSSFKNNVVSSLNNIANILDSFGQPNNVSTLTPTLAALATSVELWYDGWVFRGFFRDFEFSESSDEQGLYRYVIRFTVTRRSGVRYNSFPWHRSVQGGIENNQLSYAGLLVPRPINPTSKTPQTTVSTNIQPTVNNSSGAARQPNPIRRKIITGD